MRKETPLFEELTKHLPYLVAAESSAKRAESRTIKGVESQPESHGSEGTGVGASQEPHANYFRVLEEVHRAVYAFFKEHPEYELAHYSDILERSGLAWDGRVMSEADVSALDGQTVMALLMGAVRAERFCDGALLCFFEDGSVKRWLTRLKEIDEQTS